MDKIINFLNNWALASAIVTTVIAINNASIDEVLIFWSKTFKTQGTSNDQNGSFYLQTNL